MCRVASKLLLENLGEVVVHLSPNLHPLGKVGCASGDHKVFLEGELVPRVRTSIDHVEAGDGHHQLVVAGEVGEVAVERHPFGLRARLGRRERDAENRVRAELALIRVGLSGSGIRVRC